MSAEGWYPDPGGAPGMFRYWDGQQWSASVTATPNGVAPQPAAPQPSAGQPGTYRPGAAQPPAQPGTPLARHGGVPLITRGHQPTGPAGPSPAHQRGDRRGGLLAILLIGVVLIALVVGGVQLMRTLGGLAGPGGAAGGDPTPNLCPKRDPANETLRPRIVTGRVQGGHLSYPMLGAPWSAPEVEARVPFGRGAFTQTVPVESNYDGFGSSWVASVLVGELVAGDGFFDPQSGTDLVVKCAMGVFYGDAVVERDDRVSKAVTIGGYDGWLLETHLSFDIPRLNEKGETAIFIIVKTSDDSSSIFYASVPDSRPELLAQARQAQANLRYEP